MLNVYISNDCQKAINLLPKGTVYFPETALTEKGFADLVASYRNTDATIITNSLYLLRELDIEEVELTIHNVIFDDNDYEIKSADNVDGVGMIAVLEAELKQSDRYINKSFETKEKQ